MSQITNEERGRYIRSLLEERRACEVRGKAKRIEAIDAELERVGHRAAAPVKRAETRERKAPPAADARQDKKGGS